MIQGNRAFVAAAGLAALAACMHFGPRFQEEAAPAGKAVVYVYRPVEPPEATPPFERDRDEENVGSFPPYQVRADHEMLGFLVSGGYFVVFVEPGRREFSGWAEGSTTVEIDAEAGEAYFLRASTRAGLTPVRQFLKVVPPEIAREEIEDCRLIERGPGRGER